MSVLSIFSGKKLYVEKQFMLVCITVLYVVCKRIRRWRNNMCFFKGVLRS